MVVNRIEQKLRGRNENEIQSEDIGSPGHGGWLSWMRLPMYVLPVFIGEVFKDVSELESLLQQITQSSKKRKRKDKWNPIAFSYLKNNRVSQDTYLWYSATPIIGQEALSLYLYNPFLGQW